MKLKLTLAQASAVLRQHFNLPADAEIVIQRPPSVGPLAIRTLIKDIENMAYEGHQKIEAIKLFRSAAVGSGLADAKYSIENWPTVKAWLMKKRRFPTSYFSNGVFSLS